MKQSAGLLPFRRRGGVEVLIAHPGGPFFANRNEGAWSVVKGEIDPGEEALDTALREFREETGWEAPSGPYLELGSIIQRNHKGVTAWAVEADFDPETLDPGHFEMEWKGKIRTFTEIDRVRWVPPDEARRLLNPAQGPLVERLVASLDRPPSR